MPKAQIKEHASPESALTDWVNNYSDVLYASAVKRVSDEGLAIDLVRKHLWLLSVLWSF